MAYFFSGQSHTFNEYLLVPGYSSSECIPDNVSLRTPLTRFRAGEEPALSLNVPMVSAVMQSVSGDRLAVALAQEGGVSFLYGSQSIEDEAAMVARVKSYKAGFVRSDSNISPDATLSDILALREQTGHSTVAVTEDGTADGRLVGIVTSRDYRVSRMAPETPVTLTKRKDFGLSAFLFPEQMICLLRLHHSFALNRWCVSSDYIVCFTQLHGIL